MLMAHDLIEDPDIDFPRTAQADNAASCWTKAVPYILRAEPDRSRTGQPDLKAEGAPLIVSTTSLQSQAFITAPKRAGVRPRKYNL